MMVRMAKRTALYLVLSDAFEQTDDETLGEACERVLKDPQQWALHDAARCIMQSGDLRGDEAWAALAKARMLLPSGKSN